MRVAVAMSGGVDSSVAAALLREQGCDVVGLTALMAGERSRCCAPEDVERAQAVAAQIGIEHRVVDLREAFDSSVIRYFATEYLAGRTPSPCVECNRLIKFGRLAEDARAMGAERLATGHYARAESAGGRWRLLSAVDRAKDQSYFLALLNSRQLAESVFPLGGLRKAEVVRMAAERGLASRDRGESQELCFVEEGTHGRWLDLRRLDAPGEGDIEDTAGQKVGRHLGVHHYTVGQRKGLGLAAGKPLYVVRLDAARNVVIVGERAEAMAGGMSVAGLHWIAGAAPATHFRAVVQIRYHHLGVACRVEVRDDGVANVAFDEPQFAVTPGQLAAFREGDEVLGGGWIV